MAIPKTPCPVGGLVPWMGQLCPIEERHQHERLGWMYTLKEQREGGAVVMWRNVSQEDIVKEMDLSAKYRVGDVVEVGAFSARRILRRKWNFIKGCFTYSVEGMREGRDWHMNEDEIERRVSKTTQGQ